MKRFMCLSIGFLFLIGLIAGFNQAEAQVPAGTSYFVMTSPWTAVFTITPNGNTYAREFGNWTYLYSVRALGNFWAGVAQPPTEARYYVLTDPWDAVFAITPNGDTYAREFGNWTYTHFRALGNALEGTIAAEKSTWGSIKEQIGK